jgi:hypothetical protein
MTKVVTFGIGGYCENCDPTHDHPLYNIIEIIEIPDAETLPTDDNLDGDIN